MLLSNTTMYAGETPVSAYYGGKLVNASAAIAVLQSFGQDAHVYIPGIGMLNGLQAANFIDSTLTQNAAVDNPVGGVVDGLGGINAIQTTTGSKPILRQDANGKYCWQFDGSNDSLQLGGPLFQMADDHCVIAGASCSGISSVNNVVASPCQASSIGVSRAGQVSYDFGVLSIQSSWYDGSNYDNLLYSYPLSTPFVATSSKRGVTGVQRVNGVQRNSKTLTASFAGADKGSIGAYQDGTNSLGGYIYPVIAIKGTVTDANLLLLEKLVASMSGVTI